MCLRYLPDLVSGLAIYLVAKAKETNKDKKPQSGNKNRNNRSRNNDDRRRKPRNKNNRRGNQSQTMVKTRTAMVSRMIIANRAAISGETSAKIKMISAITKVVSLVRHNNLAMSNKSLSTRSKTASSKKRKRRRSVKLLNAENVVTSAAASV